MRRVRTCTGKSGVTLKAQQKPPCLRRETPSKAFPPLLEFGHTRCHSYHLVTWRTEQPRRRHRQHPRLYSRDFPSSSRCRSSPEAETRPPLEELLKLSSPLLQKAIKQRPQFSPVKTADRPRPSDYSTCKHNVLQERSASAPTCTATPVRGRAGGRAVGIKPAGFAKLPNAPTSDRMYKCTNTSHHASSRSVVADVNFGQHSNALTGADSPRAVRSQ